MIEIFKRCPALLNISHCVGNILMKHYTTVIAPPQGKIGNLWTLGIFFYFYFFIFYVFTYIKSGFWCKTFRKYFASHSNDSHCRVLEKSTCTAVLGSTACVSVCVWERKPGEWSTLQFPSVNLPFDIKMHECTLSLWLHLPVSALDRMHGGGRILVGHKLGEGIEGGKQSIYAVTGEAGIHCASEEKVQD